MQDDGSAPLRQTAANYQAAIKPLSLGRCGAEIGKARAPGRGPGDGAQWLFSRKHNYFVHPSTAMKRLSPD